MARSNTGSTSNRFTTATASVAAAPLTISCWFNPVNLTSSQNLCYITNAGFTQYWGLTFDGANANAQGDNVVLADANGSTGNWFGVSPTGGTANAWNHAAAVFTSATSRQAFLNGVGGTVNTTASGTTTPSVTHIASLSTFSPINGSIAELGIWNVALTAAEILSLSKGVSPLLIRPNNLIRYWPLMGVGTETCRISGETLTVVGSMAKAAHGQVLMPSLPVLGNPNSGLVNKTLAADPGSYALTGTAATLKVGRAVAAAAGSYSLSGTAATLRRNLPLIAGAGSYSLTGAAATLKHGWVVAAGAGSYALSGSAATLKNGKTLSAGIGSYALSGSAASLLHTYRVTALAGSYSLSGTAANLKVGKAVAAAAGSYALTGQAATLRLAKLVAAGVGSYSLTGSDATLTKSATTLVLVAGTGAYSLNGSTAGLLRGLKMAGGAGSYQINGTAASLRLSRLLAASSGAYSLSGTNAALTYSGGSPSSAPYHQNSQMAAMGRMMNR